MTETPEIPEHLWDEINRECIDDCPACEVEAMIPDEAVQAAYDAYDSYASTTPSRIGIGAALATAAPWLIQAGRDQERQKIAAEVRTFIETNAFRLYGSDGRVIPAVAASELTIFADEVARGSAVPQEGAQDA